VRYRFPLERLKRVRAIEERIARAAWAGAERAAREAESAVEHQRDLVAAGRADTAAGDPRRAELDRRAIDRLLQVLVARRETALTARGQAARLAADRQARERDRRALAELDERLRTRFRREAEKAEARALDEVALGRVRRRRER
jgi:hypothetical protein